MAKETVTRLIDDLDGGTAERTVSFAWDGKAYKIDLSKRNIAAFERALKPYLAASRSVSSQTRGRRGSRSTARRGPGLRDIREWARANGYDVSDRGRIAAHIIEAFNTAR